MRLAYENKEVSEIKEEHNLSDQIIFKFLKKLDDMGLIILQKENKFTFVDGPATRLRTSGTQLDQIKFEATLKLLEKVRNQPGGFLGGGIFLLDEKQLENMHADIFTFHDKYSKISMENRSAKKHKIKKSFSTQTTMILSSPDTLFDIQT
ncbi:MAG TPA: hypothetical protein PLJ21_05155 [Pseudobdellovibrionaceae bacterium]|nr:hypothetical protein [Pseudobdellovibrionaceae bacterium]